MSVPPHDTALADRLPGLKSAAGEPWPEAPAARVLSVTIYDDVLPERLRAYPRLEAVITRSDGYDHLPLTWLEQQGIAAYHVGGYATQSVAHLAVTLLTMLARRVPEAAATTRAGRWDRDALVGRHLPDLTVGLVGLGRIGAETARLLAALDVPTVGYDPEAPALDLPGHRRVDSLHELLDAVDAVSLHVPLDASTRGLIDAESMRRLGPGGLIVNTARGAVVDHDALVDALDAGMLVGYATDVLPDEPGVPDLSRLQGRPEVVVTSHIGAHNHGTIRRRYEITGRITEAILRGADDDVAGYRVR